MPDYLTKEEIRQWRGSLERITLEEFAKRLGKEISNEKETNDMVDKVYKHTSEVRYVTSDETPVNKSPFRGERISSLAQKSFEREKEMTLEKREKELIKELDAKNKSAKAAAKEESVAKKTETKVKEVKTATKKEIKAAVKEVKKTVAKAKKAEVKESPKAEITSNDDIQISFKKNLTPREQAVFEHFLNNKNHIVYAKELAQVLELPRDYVYKYIKNLRAKMNENAIQNADNGGFVLTV